MRTLFSILAIAAALSAFAGENKYLGSIQADGGLSGINNSNTQTPFVIPPTAKLTLSCPDVVSYLADNFTVSDGGTVPKGVPIPANTLFPTSVGAKLVVIGGQPSALLAVHGAVTCDVWLRDGLE